MSNRASITELEMLHRDAVRDCERGGGLTSHLVSAWLVRAMCEEIFAARDALSDDQQVQP